MNKIFLILILISAVAYSDTEFNEKKEKFFLAGKNSCLSKMMDIPSNKRQAYCECADAIHKSKVKDEDLKKYFSGDLKFDALIPKTEAMYDECGKLLVMKLNS